MYVLDTCRILFEYYWFIIISIQRDYRTMKRWMHDEWTHSNVNFNDAEWGFIWRHHYEYGILTFSVWCVPSSTIERGKGEKSRRRTKKSLIFSLNFTFSSTHRNSMANFALAKAKNRKKKRKSNFYESRRRIVFGIICQKTAHKRSFC